MATVFESSEPVSMIRRQRGIISVERRKWMTVLLSFCWDKVSTTICKFQEQSIRTLTKAPITPREVRRRYSKGRVLDVVLRNGYKNNGI